MTYTGVPWEMAERYYQEGADELCFLGITASRERRNTMTKVIEKTVEKVFVPITVGGGIKSVEDARKVFGAGADKVSINTAALQRPKLISELSQVFGAQAVVVAIDAKKQGAQWDCSIFGGKKFTDKGAVDWAKEAEALGAGEILLTSMDRDGTKQGFDLELIKAVSQAVNIPVIASGGAGRMQDFADVLQQGEADAVLAASVFHYGKYSIREVKKFLEKRGIEVRK
ncbi:MAG: imidazole glycerol phosphate synthase subunit HisF [Candidatus Diapherotrites archaeon]|uniref:Imidazole glycerol phosphate synthase subunit HisF n=1 Tax=Candidatus Iainarchaeum sp. TaxID=3101447 RepID=A0A2D6M0V0_9ARCH|nr:imidazole glycerol phosphate synthase subunit HisF [Candidatus Diapherotrites archaeon]